MRTANHNRSGEGRRPRDRRGMAMIYVVLIMLVLVGFVSLAVDVGRVNLARGQLRVGADASARAAASAVRDSHDEARARGVQYAAANTCMGTPIVVDGATDITIGHWDRETRVFTPLTPSSARRPNAARVWAYRTSARNGPIPLVFGKLIGVPTFDVRATATAAIRGGRTGYGIVGIDWIRMNGTPITDSYDSDLGPYSDANRGENGTITSNGPIRLIGTTDIYGDAQPGPAETDVDANGNVYISGDVEPLTEKLVFPPVDASPYANNNNNAVIPPAYLSKKGFKMTGGTWTVPAGTYYFSDFDLGGNATLIMAGPVTLYVTGSLKIAGNVETSGSVAANLSIQVAGRGGVDLTGTSNLYADVYAPEANVTISGTHDFFGAVVGKTLTTGGTGRIHHDEQLTRYKYPPVKVFLVE